MLRLLAVHNQVIQQAVAAHHGHVIKTVGDAFLIKIKRWTLLMLHVKVNFSLDRQRNPGVGSFRGRFFAGHSA
jgi:hypothetical protein